MENSIKAPKYFLEAVKKADETHEELAKLANVSPEWLLEQKRKGNGEGTDFIIQQLGDDGGKLELFNALLEVSNAQMEVGWIKFREANKDNKFGKAKCLHYDIDEKTINIRKKSLGCAIKDMLSK